VNPESGFNPSGSINLSSPPGSSGDGPDSLNLVRIESVAKSGDKYDVRARIRGDSVRFSSSSRVPEGSVLLGRIKETNSNYQLQVLSKTEQLQQTTQESVMRLLRNNGIDTSGLNPDSLMKTLSRKGYLSPSNLPGSGSTTTSSSLIGKQLQVTSDSTANLQSMADGSLQQGTVVATGNGTATVKINSNEITTRAPAGLNEGTSLTLELSKSGSTPTFNIQSVKNGPRNTNLLQQIGRKLNLNYSQETLNRLETVLRNTSGQSPSKTLDQIHQQFSTQSSASNERALELIQQYRQSNNRAFLQELSQELGLKPQTETLNRLRATLMNSQNRNPAEVLQQINQEFSTVSLSSGTTRETVEELIQQFQQAAKNNSKPSVDNLQSIPREKLTQLLRQMGFEADDQTLKTAQSILNTDPSPSKETLRQTLENVQLAKNNQGSVDSNRLKSVLFLAKNNLPMKNESVDLLQHAVPSSGSTDSGEAFNQLQQALSGESAKNSSLGEALQAVNLDPSTSASTEERAQQLFQAVKSMGFDLESQVPRQPEGASKTLRSQLMKLQQFFGDSATESIRQSLQSGVDSGMQDQSRKLLSQLFKYSLASVSEDDSIFLFVPFPDGDKTGMMRLRFEQEGDGEQLNDEEWNVTIHLDLSQLGPLQVQAQRHREKLNLTFKAAMERTLDVLKQREDDLGTIFTDKGFDVSVRTQPWNQDEEQLVDWDLYFDKGDFGGTFDFTV
jgi:hypothetical protein